MKGANIIDITDLVISEEEIFTLEKDFIEKVQVLGIKEIEPLLEEDVKIIGRLEKYQFLTLLRDLFIEFKKLGDTKILIEEGVCGICGARQIDRRYTSMRQVRKVLEMKGNNSNEKFHFAILSEEHESLIFRICNGYINKSGIKDENFSVPGKLTSFAKKRQDELSGYR